MVQIKKGVCVLKINMTKILSMILTISIAVTSAAALSGCSSNDADDATADRASVSENVKGITSPTLVKTVTEYSRNFETQEWEKARVIDYTYENGYPTNVTAVEADGSAQSMTEYKYTFDGNLPVTGTYSNNNYTFTVEYNNGKPYQMTAKSKDGSSSQADYYQYANDDEYFTFLLHEEHLGASEGDGEVSGDKEETDSITVVSKDGLLVKTINTGMYANWNTGEKKEWQRFNGTYTVEYDADGIATLASGVFRAGPSWIQNKYAVTKENGRVTEAIVLSPNNETGDFDEFSKFIFEYTDTEISDSRYAMMINSFLLGETSSYYRYLWY